MLSVCLADINFLQLKESRSSESSPAAEISNDARPKTLPERVSQESLESELARICGDTPELQGPYLAGQYWEGLGAPIQQPKTLNDPNIYRTGR